MQIRIFFEHLHKKGYICHIKTIIYGNFSDLIKSGGVPENSRKRN